QQHATFPFGHAAHGDARILVVDRAAAHADVAGEVVARRDPQFHAGPAGAAEIHRGHIGMDVKAHYMRPRRYPPQAGRLKCAYGARCAPGENAMGMRLAMMACVAMLVAAPAWADMAALAGQWTGPGYSGMRRRTATMET